MWLFFFNVLGYAGIGVVFHDHIVQIISTLSQRIPLIHSMELAEAMVAQRAVYLPWN